MGKLKKFLARQKIQLARERRKERGEAAFNSGLWSHGELSTRNYASYSDYIAHQRAKTYASSLYATLAKTRSKAVALNGNVTLNPAAGGWGNGWQMNDPNGNALDNAGAAQGVTIAGPAVVTYTASGRLQAGAAPVFQITTTSGVTTIYQCVSVDLGGRPYMVAASTC